MTDLDRVALRYLRTVVFWVITAIFGTVITAPFVMFGWNWSVPSIFGLPEIGFWQAVGLWWCFSSLIKGYHYCQHDG